MCVIKKNIKQKLYSRIKKSETKKKYKNIQSPAQLTNIVSFMVSFVHAVLFIINIATM